MIITILENFQARSMSHWSPYDRVGAVHAVARGLFFPAYASLRPSPLAFNPDATSTPFSSASDARELHPDVALNDGTLDPQEEDGSVRVPEPLQPFMGGLKVLTPEDVAAKK